MSIRSFVFTPCVHIARGARSKASDPDGKPKGSAVDLDICTGSPEALMIAAAAVVITRV
jgi:hypothetical protein